MSYDTYRQFEADLQAKRQKRKIPIINKTVFKRVILSTEAHNRNQEEQEMWMKHFASKKSKDSRRSTSEDSQDEQKERKRKKRKKKKREKFSQEKDSPKNQRSYSNFPTSAKNDPEIGPNVNDYLVSKNLKWGHDGFHELYGDQDLDPSSESDKNEHVSRKKIKKSKKRKKKKSKWVEKVVSDTDSDSSSNSFNKKKRKKDR